MAGRLAVRLRLHITSSLVQSLGFTGSLESISASVCSTSAAHLDGAIVPCIMLESERWSMRRHYAVASKAFLASNSWNCHQRLILTRSNGFVLISSGSSMQVPSPYSDIDTSQRRWMSEDATRCVDRKCWSCNEATSSGNRLFCTSCRAVQPLDESLDFFQIFNLDRSFSVDVRVLEQRYKELQKKLHPDLVTSKSQREQEYSAEQSAHVIQAYYVLLRPLSRARYMLGLNGIKVDEEGTIDDPELLMEIMEIRESIEDSSGAEEIMQAQVLNYERLRICDKALETAFRDGDLANAVAWVQRLAYYNKVGEEILRKM